jgi:hypothetical protein
MSVLVIDEDVGRWRGGVERTGTVLRPELDPPTGMDLTPATVDELAEEYREREPFYPVEREQQETLPRVLRRGEFGRRDAEWVVRWYFRRHLGEQSHAERRVIEERFADNPFGDVLEAITAAAEDAVTSDTGDAATTAAGDADDRDLEAAIDRLTALDGVDVPVATAFLSFLDPETYVVCGAREWDALRQAGYLDRPYPDPPTVEDYREYRSACLSIAEGTDRDPWTVRRALWRLTADDRDAHETR